MAWKTIANSLTADASDMNDNFNLVRAGTMEPRTSAGASFVTTDSAYDIGSDSARWNNVYCNNVNAAGSVTTSDRSLWILISEPPITSSDASIDISGLNGDVTDTYMIITRATASKTAGVSINFDPFYGASAGATAPSGSQYIQGASSTVTAVRDASTSSEIEFINTSASTAGSMSLTRSIFYAKTGNERTMISQIMKTDNGGTEVATIRSKSYIWNNTSDTITTMRFRFGNANINSTSVIQIWGRK